MGVYIGSFPLYLGDLLQLWNNPVGLVGKIGK